MDTKSLAAPQAAEATTISDLPANWEYITMTPSQLKARMARNLEPEVLPKVQASPLIAGLFVVVVIAYLLFCSYRPLGASDAVQNWADVFVFIIMIGLALFDTSIAFVSPTLRMIIGLIAGGALVAAARS